MFLQAPETNVFKKVVKLFQAGQGAKQRKNMKAKKKPNQTLMRKFYLGRNNYNIDHLWMDFLLGSLLLSHFGSLHSDL